MTLFKNNVKLPGVMEITVPLYSDSRGYNMETYDKLLWDDLDITFHTDTMSRSKKDVLRGLHGDFITGKLVQCLYGDLFLTVVDIRPGTSTTLMTYTTVLSSNDGRQIYIPPGFLNGHLCLSEECVFSYKLTQPYNPKQISVKWNDPILTIDWPIQNPILSIRDQQSKIINEQLESLWNEYA